MPQTEFQHFRSLISECSDKPKPSKTHQKALLSARAHQNTFSPQKRLVSLPEGKIKAIWSRSRGRKLQPAYRLSVSRKHGFSLPVTDVFLFARMLLQPAAAASSEQACQTQAGILWDFRLHKLPGSQSMAATRRLSTAPLVNSAPVPVRLLGNSEHWTRAYQSPQEEKFMPKTVTPISTQPTNIDQRFRLSIPATCYRDFCFLVKAFAF